MAGYVCIQGPIQGLPMNVAYGQYWNVIIIIIIIIIIIGQ